MEMSSLLISVALAVAVTTFAGKPDYWWILAYIVVSAIRYLRGDERIRQLPSLLPGVSDSSVKRSDSRLEGLSFIAYMLYFSFLCAAAASITAPQKFFGYTAAALCFNMLILIIARSQLELSRGAKAFIMRITYRRWFWISVLEMITCVLAAIVALIEPVLMSQRGIAILGVIYVVDLYLNRKVLFGDPLKALRHHGFEYVPAPEFFRDFWDPRLTNPRVYEEDRRWASADPGLQRLVAGKDVADLGCGDGRYFNMFGSLARSWLGIDLADPAKMALPAAMEYHQGDFLLASRPGQKAAGHNLVFVNFVLSNYLEFDAVLNAALAHARHGGAIVITDLLSAYPRNDDDYILRDNTKKDKVTVFFYHSLELVLLGLTRRGCVIDDVQVRGKTHGDDARPYLFRIIAQYV